jgi:hypothetical protein
MKAPAVDGTQTFDSGLRATVRSAGYPAPSTFVTLSQATHYSWSVLAVSAS